MLIIKGSHIEIRKLAASLLQWQSGYVLRIYRQIIIHLIGKAETDGVISRKPMILAVHICRADFINGHLCPLGIDVTDYILYFYQLLLVGLDLISVAPYSACRLVDEDSRIPAHLDFSSTGSDD